MVPHPIKNEVVKQKNDNQFLFCLRGRMGLEPDSVTDSTVSTARLKIEERMHKQTDMTINIHHNIMITHHYFLRDDNRFLLVETIASLWFLLAPGPALHPI
jgi:hypothetical protein